MIGSGAPDERGRLRPIHIIAPPGTVVNVRHPGACVGGQTELQPRIVDLVQGRVLARSRRSVAAAAGGTACNFLFGGIHPRTGEYYTNYHFEGSGWGGRARTTATTSICPHGNCRNTPVEVFETRYPWFTECYQLNADAGGPGRTRGGLGITRLLHVEADEIVVSALCDRSKVAPWGVYGGHDGDRLAYLVRTAGSSRFRTFSEAFGTPSDTKFSNVRLHRGDVVMLRSPSGGGYGPPWERPPEHVAEDVVEGYVSRERASASYGVVVRADGTSIRPVPSARGPS